ncbi:hypothetical protein D3C73_855850 [compost metagenome]
MHQIGQTHLLRAGDFHRAVHRRAQGGVRHGQRHIVRRNRLHIGRREPYFIALRARLHDAAQELKELRAVHDGVRNTPGFNQIFLRDLAAKVPAFRQAMRAHHRQRNMVAHAGPGFGRQQVAPRGLEERQHRRVFKRWRVGHVNHRVHARQRIVQALAGHRIHARGGRSRNGLMATLDKQFDEFGADQAGTAND